MLTPKMKRSAALLAIAGLTVVGVAACSDDDGDSASAGTTTEMEMPAPSSAVSVSSPAADLRVALDRLLGEHALLAVFAMQKGADGDKDFDAIAGALEANTVDLGNAIESVYGEEAETGFLDLWRKHIGFFVDYTVATAGDDADGQAAALEALDGYREGFSTFLAGANPNIEADPVAAGLQMHVNQLTGALMTYQSGNFAETYANVRESYLHMFGTGDTLAGAISAQFPDKFSDEGTTPAAVDLRVALDRLLGEHAMLAAFAMQKGLDGDKDFDAIAGALEANTVDLGNAIESVYGEEAETGFLDLWRKHIGFFVDYTVATAGDDADGQAAALEALDGYREGFSTFLAGANPNLEAGPLAEGLQMHVDQLTTALTTYKAGEYAKAYEQVRASYAHMFGTGDALSGAIVAQFPENFSAS